MISVNVAVCDDNKRTLQLVSGTIETALSDSEYSCHVYSFSSAAELLASDVDFALAFLDIDMPEIDGIRCGEQLRERKDNMEIIYISSRSDRVFETFSVRPFGFVRKSNFLADLDDVLDRYKKYIGNAGVSRSLSCKTHNGSISIPVSKIEYIEGNNMYQEVYLHQQDKPTEIISQMETLERALEEYGFIRIHKGYLVNYSYIQRISRTELILSSGKTLPVSRRNAHLVKERYLALSRRFGVIQL